MKSLRLYMKRENLNQTALARKLGVDRFVISKWLSCNRKPSNKYLWKISEITGVDFVKTMKEWE